MKRRKLKYVMLDKVERNVIIQPYAMFISAIRPAVGFSVKYRSAVFAA